MLSWGTASSTARVWAFGSQGGRRGSPTEGMRLRAPRGAGLSRRQAGAGGSVRPLSQHFRVPYTRLCSKPTWPW